jgi:hypothetical protein
MKIKLWNNKNTTSKDWFYLLPGIGIMNKHLCFYWFVWIIDICFKDNKNVPL